MRRALLHASLTLMLVVSSCSEEKGAPSPPATTPPNDAAPPIAPVPDATPPLGPVTVRILGINDFHGALEPAAGAPDVGGAPWLAAHVAKERTAKTFFLSAGDLIG